MKPYVSLGSSELPVMNESTQDEEDDELAGKEEMESMLPKGSIYLGRVEDEVDGFCMSWVEDDHYYIVPLDEGDYDWAIVRIYWDDNWGHHDWCVDARIKRVKDPHEAAGRALRKLFRNWGKDLRRKKNKAYYNLLNEL